MPPLPPQIIKFGARQPCLGLAFIGPGSLQISALKAIRDDVSRIAEGYVEQGENRFHITFVELRRPKSGLAQMYPQALPLALAKPGVLTSYFKDDGEAAAGIDAKSSNAANAASVRAVELWWSGQPLRVSLHLLRSVPRTQLWEMPEVAIHTAIIPDAAANESDNRAASADANRAKTRKAAQPFGSAISESLAARLLKSQELSDPDPFGELREGLKRPSAFGENMRRLGWYLAGTWPRIWKVFAGLATVALILLATFVVVAVLVSGLKVLGLSIAGFFVGFMLLRFLGGLIGGAISYGSASHDSARERGPGLFENFLGWLAWKNPFSSVHRQVSQRVKQLESMMARGQIDEALKLAFRLGNNRPGSKHKRTIYPRELPSARATLDFDYVDSGFGAPILSDGQDWELRQRYFQLAEQLEKDGDLRRAAFIYSQLLGEHEEAVRLLEKAKLPHEALKLALAGKVNPAITVRLLYEAGRKQEALALAVRAGCFEALVEQSRKKDAVFHIDVIKAWTEALIDSGQVLRALQVTDELANQIGANTTLLALRRSWLGAVLVASQGSNLPAEAVARALLTCTLEHPDPLEQFPERLRATGDELLDMALDRLQDATQDDRGGDDLLGVLTSLRRLALRKSPEQNTFWSGPGSTLLEQLGQCLLRQGSSQLQTPDLDALGQLLNMAGHRVLARDLTKLNRLIKSSEETAREWTVPPLAAQKPMVTRACVLGNGTILAWRDSGFLELMDKNGAMLWRERFEQPSAIIPVGQGSKVLILREGLGAQTIVSCFDTASRTMREIGSLALKAHHDITDELGWMVQVGGRIGALSLARMTTQEPEFEFLWSCSLTDRLQTIAFCHGLKCASWATVDVSPDRLGIIELWKFTDSGDLETFILRPGENGQTGQPNPPMLWAWSQDRGSIMAPLSKDNAWLAVQQWDEYSERQVRLTMAKRARDEGIDHLVPCDLDRSAAVVTDGKIEIRSHERSGPRFELHHDKELTLYCHARLPLGPADRLTKHAKRHARTSGKVLLGDTHGRLFLVDPRTARVREL
ncbi:hypothetical protein [uncultured Erythrobacter sp.]|uniref:tetratricopeptide repeat protein n=1 Tax=uncultured Erythrobacter sp. TaxID=263913 RepID=UPI002638804E|nr:hypothetical protein [uncultured Erythrobacter sp.]